MIGREGAGARGLQLAMRTVPRSVGALTPTKEEGPMEVDFEEASTDEGGEGPHSQ